MQWVNDALLPPKRPTQKPASKEVRECLFRFSVPVSSDLRRASAVGSFEVCYPNTSRKRTVGSRNVVKLFIRQETLAVSEQQLYVKEEPVNRYSKQLAERFLFLAADAESDPEFSELSMQSQQSFEAFWALNSNLNLKLPDITLTPDGDVYARWSAADGNVFSAHFLAGHRVKGVLFKPDAEAPGQKVRKLIKSTPIDSFVGVVIARDEISWACH